VEYQLVYRSGEAAAFANVPNAAVYRALREDQLRAMRVFEGGPRRITHENLVAWITTRGFPIPGPIPARPEKPLRTTAPMTPKAAAKLLGLKPERLQAAIMCGALKAAHGLQPRVSQSDLDAWVAGGTLASIVRTNLDPYLLYNHLPES